VRSSRGCGSACPRALHDLRRLYFDTALSTTESALAALTAFAPSTQIVFGSDVPMAPPPLVADLDSSPTLDAATRAAIDRENALRLFPRFARVAVNS
jgi:predicted TIM-barrel fold metal-dependent hydrolase